VEEEEKTKRLRRASVVIEQNDFEPDLGIDSDSESDAQVSLEDRVAELKAAVRALAIAGNATQQQVDQVERLAWADAIELTPWAHDSFQLFKQEVGYMFDDAEVQKLQGDVDLLKLVDASPGKVYVEVLQQSEMKPILQKLHKTIENCSSQFGQCIPTRQAKKNNNRVLEKAYWWILPEIQMVGLSPAPVRKSGALESRFARSISSCSWRRTIIIEGQLRVIAKAERAHLPGTGVAIMRVALAQSILYGRSQEQLDISEYAKGAMADIKACKSLPLAIEFDLKSDAIGPLKEDKKERPGRQRQVEGIISECGGEDRGRLDRQLDYKRKGRSETLELASKRLEGRQSIRQAAFSGGEGSQEGQREVSAER